METASEKMLEFEALASFRSAFGQEPSAISLQSFRFTDRTANQPVNKDGKSNEKHYCNYFFGTYAN